jgi:hypothetical protein
MFVDMRTGQKGLVAQYDVVCFDEVSGINFDQKDGVNIMKGYMESGEFSRGRESIRADGGIVLVGNFDVDVERQLRAGHLFGPLPKEMRDDTAFMDRIHAYIPGWDVPKLHPGLFTEHFGFVSDFISECWTRLRSVSHVESVQGRLKFGEALSGRDRTAVTKTVDGLLKLLHPDPEMHIEDAEIEWAAHLALECRRRVKEQQKRIGQAEFENTAFSFILNNGAEAFVSAPDFRASADDSGSREVPAAHVPPAKEQISVIRFYNTGDVIDDRFEVEAHLGDGGFSSVYRVHDKLEGVSRALKVFVTRGAEDALKREIGFLRLVDHPNVVRVIWADRTDDGQSYLVSELVEGKSLDDYVRGGEQLSDQEAVEAVLQLLDALAAIHPDQTRVDAIRAGEISADELAELQELQHVGVVHRDVKPNNIILTPKGIKLLDFNIASRVGDPVVTVSGTEPYQAPDADYTNWDVSTDLFAAGVVLYELLCGVHPYDDDRPRIDAFPRDPRQFKRDLSADIAAFLMKACAPDRELRFRSAREMRDALANAAGVADARIEGV